MVASRTPRFYGGPSAQREDRPLEALGRRRWGHTVGGGTTPNCLNSPSVSMMRRVSLIFSPWK